MTDESTAPEGVETDEHAQAPAEVPEVDETAAETDIDQDDDAPESEGEGDEQPEEIEFDFGGNKLRVPKGSVPEELAAKIDDFVKGTWSSATKRSQEVAERAKALEARERAVETLSTMSDDVLDTFTQAKQVKRELDQLEKVDINALWQSDPDRARRVSDAISQKRAEFEGLVKQVGQKEAALTEAQSKERARQVEFGRAEAEKIVKGFAEKVPAVVDYVSNRFGLPKDALERDWPLNHATAVMAYESMLYRQMQAQAKKPASKPAAAAPVKPVAAGRSGREVKDIAKMSMTEYAEYMNRQERKASARR